MAGLSSLNGGGTAAAVPPAIVKSIKSNVSLIDYYQTAIYIGLWRKHSGENRPIPGSEGLGPTAAEIYTELVVFQLLWLSKFHKIHPPTVQLMPL